MWKHSLFAEIQNLAHGRALLIWYKICGKDTFRGIEWSSLSAKLIDEHCRWFNTDELEKLTDEEPKKCKEAVNNAMKRTAPGVLHAFYQSLCA